MFLLIFGITTLTVGGPNENERPPAKAVIVNGAVEYFEVRADVFDSLSVWAHQREFLFAEISALKDVVSSDSALSLLHEAIYRNMQNQLEIERRRGDVYKEVLEVRRGGMLRRFWDESKFPIGIALGAFVASQTIKEVK